MSNLHVDSITKSFNGNVLLSDVFISCQKGEIKGLIGRNGSGKTTLLKIIFGAEKSDYKFIRIGDRIVNNMPFGRNPIAYLPQDNFLPNNISIKRLINLFLQKEKREILLKNEYVQPLLKKVNQDLSGGERRIIEILLLLHSNAEYLLLDEPFNGVSPIVRDYIVECIKDMKASKGIIITDHDHERIIHLADCILYLQNGYLKELKDKRELAELGYFSGATFSD